MSFSFLHRKKTETLLYRFFPKFGGATKLNRLLASRKLNPCHFKVILEIEMHLNARNNKKNTKGKPI
jgi:hypothetical protein